MANTTSTSLKLTVQATGENSGTWGQITNTNLLILEQAIGGYDDIGVTSGATLTFSNGVLSNGKNQVLKLIGTIAGAVNVVIPDGIEKTYIVNNATTGAYSVTFKTSSGSGVTWGATDKTTKIVYTDGTDVLEGVSATSPGGTDKQIQFNDNGSFGGITMGTTGQILTTDGTTASFQEPAAGGTSWQAVKTTGFTAVAGEGYFINTTGGAFTMTLPLSPTIGDEVAFIDYAGTFDTNNLTIGRNSENIQGSAADLTVSVERAANTLVYTDGTQGWLLKVK
jgi:hypothetical protein